MFNLTLGDVIKNCKDGEVYIATFARDEHWYITKSAGFIWYCDESGKVFQDIPVVPLTYSNLRADYELLLGHKL